LRLILPSLSDWTTNFVSFFASWFHNIG
jgi:hypothetical protein